MSDLQQKRIKDAHEAASLKYWEEITEHFPEATSGDCEPPYLMRFDEAGKSLVENWVDWNCPEEEVAENESR